MEKWGWERGVRVRVRGDGGGGYMGTMGNKMSRIKMSRKTLQKMCNDP